MRASPESIFKSKVVRIEENRYRLPNYWEDLESGSCSRDNAEVVRSVGILTHEKDVQLHKTFIAANYLAPPVLLQPKHLRQMLDMLLMSIESDLFVIDTASNCFIITNVNVALENVLEGTLKSFLREFVEPASNIYRLKLIQNRLDSNPNMKAFVTNTVMLQTLNEYLHFVNKSIMETDKTLTLLEYHHVLSNMLHESNFIYSLYSSMYPLVVLPGDAEKTQPTDRLNLDLIYKICNNTCLYGQGYNNIVKTILQDMCQVLYKWIIEILFINGEPERLLTTMNIVYRRDKNHNFIFENVPHILKKTMNSLIQCAQVLSLLKRYDMDLFRILVSWNMKTTITYDSAMLTSDTRMLESVYKKAVTGVEEYFMKIEIERQERKIKKMQESLNRLKIMKERIESEQLEKLKLKEIENFKRAQLQHFLDEQIAEKRLRNAYEKEIEKEKEKSLIYDRVLKEQKAEKEKMLKEIEGLGRGVDDEIEKAVIKDNLEKIQLNEDDEEDGEEQDEERKEGSEASQGLVENKMRLEEFINPLDADQLKVSIEDEFEEEFKRSQRESSMQSGSVTSEFTVTTTNPSSVTKTETNSSATVNPIGTPAGNLTGNLLQKPSENSLKVAEAVAQGAFKKPTIQRNLPSLTTLATAADQNAQNLVQADSRNQSIASEKENSETSIQIKVQRDSEAVSQKSSVRDGVLADLSKLPIDQKFSKKVAPQISSGMLLEPLPLQAVRTKSSRLTDSEIADVQPHTPRRPKHSPEDQSSALGKSSKQKLSHSRTDKKLRPVREGEFNVNLKEMQNLTNSNLIGILKSKIQPKEDEAGPGEVLEEPQEEPVAEPDEEGLFVEIENCDPPVDIMVDWWINRVVFMQAKLANQTIIQLLFQKHNLFDVLAHLKSVFLCERGDIASEFMESIFTYDSRIDRFGIMNANSSFQAYESPKCPEVKFKLQLKPETDLEYVSCIGNANGVSHLVYR